MATFKSTTKTAQDAAAAKAGSYISDARHISGRLRFAQAVLTVPAGTAAADILKLIDLPAGASIIPALSCVVVANAAGAGTLSIGTAADTDAICAGLDVSTTGKKELGSLVPSVLLTERTTIQAVLAGAGLTEDAVVYFNFAYAIGE